MGGKELREPPLRLTVEDADAGRYRTALAIRDGVPVELMIDWVLLAMGLLTDSAMKLRVRRRAAVYDDPADEEFQTPVIELRDLGEGAYSVHVLDPAGGEWRRWGPYPEDAARGLREAMLAKLHELRERGIPPAALDETLKPILDRVGLSYPGADLEWPDSARRAMLADLPWGYGGMPVHPPDCGCVGCLVADGLDPERLALHLSGMVDISAEIAGAVEARRRGLTEEGVGARLDHSRERGDQLGPGLPNEEGGRLSLVRLGPDDLPDDLPTLAARLRWIVDNDYADEGTSSRLPLTALAEVLEVAADVAANEGATPRLLALRSRLEAADGWR
jgi:hypothetical protein